MFDLFDPDADRRVTSGNLPHWYQPGVTYFIRFRTTDSIPAAVSAAWHRDRDDWLRRHAIDPDSIGWSSNLAALPAARRQEFHREFARAYLECLDRGHGECALARPDVASIVADSLMYADGRDYRTGDFVVMPNHVHLLVGLLGQTDVLALCRSWKHFTATRINRALGRKGRFWQAESFDHLVRSAAELRNLRRYIAENPAKANLKPGQAYHYVSPAMQRE